MRWREWSLLVGVLLAASSAFADIYRYQDEQGRWHFTDRAPADRETEKLEYESRQPEPDPVLLEPVLADGRFRYRVHNRLHAPVEVRAWYASNEKVFLHEVIPADSEQVTGPATEDRRPFHFRWVMGEPGATHEDVLYRIPFDSPLPRKITQGFGGRFSHTSPTSRHAVDIALPVGTPIVAARAGTVIVARDSYPMAGQSLYFLDKANVIRVLHEDGTQAVYAHIHLDSARVEPGDRVDAGEVLASSGSTGFSTGPHLHFVIQRNAGMALRSVPFRFAGPQGRPIHPAAGKALVAP